MIGFEIKLLQQQYQHQIDEKWQNLTNTEFRDGFWRFSVLFFSAFVQLDIFMIIFLTVPSSTPDM